MTDYPLLYDEERDFDRFLIADMEEPRKIDSSVSGARRDFSRLVYSPSFRRLQGKTQLFPTGENHPFYRNRLTHSIEVSNIAATLAASLNKSQRALVDRGWRIDPDIVAFAGLAHDLGHPPFGHTGEMALEEVMKDYGGFEGNAQTFRILTRLEHRISLFHEEKGFFSTSSYLHENHGLNLTYRTLASILKYDKKVGAEPDARLAGVGPNKGYYEEESEFVEAIKNKVIRQKYSAGNVPRLYTVECQLMDLADDIAYSTFDLEDCLCADFLNPMDFLAKLDGPVMARILAEVNSGLAKRGMLDPVSPLAITACLYRIFEDLFRSGFEQRASTATGRAVVSAITYAGAKDIQAVNRLRRRFSMERIENLMSAVSIGVNDDEPALSQVTIEPDALLEIECLKAMNYELVISSPQLRAAEFSGKRTVQEIFEAVSDDLNLLPIEFREQINEDLRNSKLPEERVKARVTCDFIAGMTDGYAAQFYSQITGQAYASVLSLRPYS